VVRVTAPRTGILGLRERKPSVSFILGGFLGRGRTADIAVGGCRSGHPQSLDQGFFAPPLYPQGRARRHRSGTGWDWTYWRRSSTSQLEWCDWRRGPSRQPASSSISPSTSLRGQRRTMSVSCKATVCLSPMDDKPTRVLLASVGATKEAAGPSLVAGRGGTRHPGRPPERRKWQCVIRRDRVKHGERA